MKINNLLIVCLNYLAVIVNGLNYILVRKNSNISNLNLNYFNKEHGIENLAQVGDLEVYKMSVEKYDMFSSTVNDLFDVELDQEYKVIPLYDGEDVIWVQKPGETQFSLAEFKSDGEFPWHLDRISKRDLPLNGKYPYWQRNTCHRNNNVTIHTYIVDTGVDVKHDEFSGNIKFLENFSGDNIARDCNSHGTFCSSIVGGKTFGVCKDAKMFGVKVLDCRGSGTTSGVIAGMNYVYNQHLELSKNDSRIRSIMSMSLGGGYSAIMNKVVEKMVKESNTFYVVVAAGNENNDACETSPASAKGIFSVMASDKGDKRAYFSNWGTCAQIYAPGVNIQGAVLDNKNAIMSGTSFSAPNVAGVINHYLDKYPSLNMEKLMTKMLNDSTKDKIKSNKGQGTANLLVYINRNEM